ncbi:MAG TPA: hypothetical protein VGP62_09200, partial [Bryobacteraceae bacterium]|nr:hypothetical protein [Bryobacteraceae bacterium]
KIKFDRQIVAIAKVEGADAIYSTDPDVSKHAQKVGIKCLGIADLPTAPSVQEELSYDEVSEEDELGGSQDSGEDDN